MRILLIWGSIFYFTKMSELVYLSFFRGWKGLGGTGQRTIILLYQTKIKVNCSNQSLSAYSKLKDAGEKKDPSLTFLPGN